MQQLDEIKSEGVAEMLVNNERRQSLGNVQINTAKNRVSHVFTSVLVCAQKFVIGACLLLFGQGELSFCTAGHLSPLHHEGRGLTSRQISNKTTSFSRLWQNLPGISGDKKAISATWPLCWPGWFEKRGGSRSAQDNGGLFSRQWQISLRLSF